MSTVAFDVAAVRARFAALQRQTAFLDGPAGTQAPDSVIEAMASYLRESNANPGGAFAASSQRPGRGRARTTPRRASSAPRPWRSASART